MKPWLILLLATPGLAEITDNVTVRADSRTGVSVQGQASISVTGTGSSPQSNSPYILVPNPSYRSTAPGSTPSSLTDSNTFFQSIGRESAPQPERRHRRRPDATIIEQTSSAPSAATEEDDD